MFGWMPVKERVDDALAEKPVEQRIVVDKRTQRIRYEQETETVVTIVIEPKEES